MKTEVDNKIDMDKKIEDFKKLHPVRYQEIVNCLYKKHPTLSPEGWCRFWVETLCKNEQKINMQPVDEFRYRWYDRPGLIYEKDPK